MKHWTSGFFPGSLWYLYELSGNEQLKSEATRFTFFVEDAKYRTNNQTMLDATVSHADYYFIEGLLRYKQMKK